LGARDVEAENRIVAGIGVQDLEDRLGINFDRDCGLGCAINDGGDAPRVTDATGCVLVEAAFA